MSHCIRKPTICICENKATVQPCSNCTADQHLCFRSLDSANCTADQHLCFRSLDSANCTADQRLCFRSLDSANCMADQRLCFRSLDSANCTADQRLCFRSLDSAIPLPFKSKISRFYPAPEIVQSGMCRTWSETQIVGISRTGSDIFRLKLPSEVQHGTKP